MLSMAKSGLEILLKSSRSKHNWQHISRNYVDQIIVSNLSSNICIITLLCVYFEISITVNKLYNTNTPTFQVIVRSIEDPDDNFEIYF